MKNNFHRRLSFAAVTVALLAAAALAPAYDLIYAPGGARLYWNFGTIPVVVRMAQTPTLQDGTSYATSIEAAMQAWNAQLADVQFAPTLAAAGLAGDFNGVNEIAFDTKIYSNAADGGTAFGPNVLAVTLSYRSATARSDGSYERTQSDILFNSAWNWNSYRGPLQAAQDIRRVAIHELGHVLGLTHPDQTGQTVTAIMNSTVSNIDALQDDDLTGAQFFYGRPGGFTAPANDNFADASVITLSNSAASVAGSSVGASKQPGEPQHAPGEPGGASVWWKWTAPANGSLTATTAGSPLDTMLGVYTGATVSALTQLAANDDVNPGIVRTSTATVAVTQGTVYYFAVDGWDGWWGSVTLNLSYTAAGTPPAIVEGPVDRRITAGASTMFSVTATGTAPLSYQWLRENVAIAGATSATYTLASATVADAGSYTVRVSNVAGSAISGPAMLSVDPPPVTFDTWRGAQFSETESGQPAISGPLADPDGDGLSNLVEYALGLSPRVPSPDPAVVGANDTEWTYTFARPSDRADITYVVEASADLATWSSGAVSLARLSVADGIETWRAVVPRAPGANCFFRLVITR